MNMFKEVNKPFNFWTSFFNVGELIHIIALHLLGFYLIPCLVKYKPRNLPTFTLESAFFRAESHVIFLDPHKHPLEMSSVKYFMARFHNHVVHIHLQRLSYLLLEDLINHSLISCVSVL